MIFRASAMPRVMPCPGSYSLEALYPDQETDAASEGTLAHQYAQREFLHPDAVPMLQDADMFRAVKLYAATCTQHKAHRATDVEKPLSLQGDGYEIHGIPDFAAWSRTCLTIIDFKYSYGWVEPEENWQLLTYAILLWLTKGGMVIPPEVRLIIVQPRANHPRGPVREWVFDGALLRGYANQLQNTCSAIVAGSATCNTGLHCRYCRALTDCHTSRACMAHISDYAGAPATTELSGEDIATELEMAQRALSLVQHRYTALATLAEEKIKSGQIVPGYRLHQPLSALKWDVPDPVAAARDLGKDIAKPVEPVTPTQALNRGLLTQEQVNFMASRKPGAVKLEKENLNFAKGLIADANAQ